MLLNKIKTYLPEPLKKLLRPVYHMFVGMDSRQPISVPTSPELIEYLKVKCEKDKINLVLRDGFGDCLFIISLRQQMEMEYNARIHYLIKPSCEFLMKMFSISDYEVIDELSVKDTEQGNYINETAQPLIGGLFFPHPRFNKETAPLEVKKNNYNFALMWRDFLVPGLSSVKYLEPVSYPKLSKKVVKDLKGRERRLVVLLPEAHSDAIYNISWWNSLASELVKNNYVVVCNAVKKANRIRGTINYLNLSMEDLIALCMKARTVVAVRNGVCDLCHELGERLIVVYDAWPPSEFNYFSLNVLFGRGDVHEYRNSQGLNIDEVIKIIDRN